jgi:NOL1/NOP2/fmu family ribosome biogenesis protein
MKKSLKPLASKEKKLLLTLIKNQWSADFKPELVFFRNEKDKIYAVHKDIAKIDLSGARINTVGMYFGEEKKGELRLSIEGSQLIGPIAKKNVVELEKEEVLEWMRGVDLHKECDCSGFVIIKHNDDFMGTGKYTQDKRILNFVPKARRLILGELP